MTFISARISAMPDSLKYSETARPAGPPAPVTIATRLFMNCVPHSDACLAYVCRTRRFGVWQPGTFAAGIRDEVQSALRQTVPSMHRMVAYQGDVDVTATSEHSHLSVASHPPGNVGAC